MYFTNRVLDFQLDDENVLLINTISSAFDQVDRTTYGQIQQLQSGNFGADIDEELLQVLISRGYIFEEARKEDELIAKFANIHNFYMEKNPSRNFTICPTMGCNLRCTYCFEGNANLGSRTVMTEEQLDAVLSYIDASTGASGEEGAKNSISLFGGEPLLPMNKPIVQKTLAFAKARNFDVRIVTNGTTIKYYLPLLKQYDNIAIQITLDGSKDIHDVRRVGAKGQGTFDAIEASVDLLVEHRITTHLRTNINRDNMDSLPELIDFIRAKGWVESGYVYPYVAPVLDYCDGSDQSMRESELYAKLLEVEPTMGSESSVIKMVVSPCVNYLHTFFDHKSPVKPWKLSYCEATSGGNLVFSPDGQISTCLMLAGKGHHQIGAFDETQVRLDPEREAEWKGRTVLRIEKCRSCKYSLICGGGCPVAALDVNGDIDCPVCSDIEATMNVFIEARKHEILQKA